MSDRTAKQYADILRGDFAAFIHRSFLELNADTFEFNWHMEVLAAKLEAVRRGEILRLIINLPPRSLKSHISSVAFPAFLLGHDPATEVLCVSYGQDLSNDLAGSCRSLMGSPFYQGVFDTRLSPDRQAIEEFKTTAGGCRRSTSVSGGLTGRGADIIIIDDPIKADDAQSDARRDTVNANFYNTIYSRLNSRRTGAIIIVMQRLHANDLVAFVQEREKWEVVAFPAIAEADERYMIQTPYGPHHIVRKAGEPLHPVRESLTILEDLRARYGEYIFSAQYQQEPLPPTGSIVKRHWLKYYTPSELPKFELVLQSWDTANKVGEFNSFSACTTWGIKDHNFYLLHVFRERLDYPDLKRKARELREVHHADVVLIEDKASGQQLIQELRQEGIAIEAAPITDTEKEVRLRVQTAKFESGFVHLPFTAPWLDVYVSELIGFPLSKFDDQVDSTVHALAWDTQQGNIPGLGLIRFYQQQAAKLAGGSNESEQKLIRLKVEPGSYQTLTRTVCPDENGTITVTEEEAGPFLKSGRAQRID